MKKLDVMLVALVLGGSIIISGCTSQQASTQPDTDSAANKNTDGKCIITVNSAQYDVTSFKTEHKGGDIFKCGEDMTIAFKNAHGEDLKRLEQFKI